MNSTLQQQLRDMNEALLVSSVHQHELTEQAQHSEAVMRASEKRFREMIDALPAAIYTTDADGRLTHFNPACVELSGRTPQLGCDQWCVTWKLFHPDGTPMPHEECPMAIALKEGRVVRGTEAIAERPDGTRIWFTPYPTPLRDAQGKVVGGITMLVDITERKRAEEALLESEQRFRVLADSTSALIWVNGPEGCQFVNRQYLEFLGVDPAAVRGYDWSQFIHPEDRDNYVNAYLRAMDQRGVFEAEFRFRRHDGEYRWMRSEAQPRLGHNGEFLGYAGLTIDITERKRAGEQVRRNAETFSKLVDQSPFGLYTVDSEFRIAQVSAGAQPAFRNVRPLIGRDFGEAIRIIWSEPFAGEVIDIFRHTLETGESYLAPSLTEQRHDIDVVESYEWQIHRVTLPDGHYGIVCYFFDATRLREAEEQLRRYAADLQESDRRKNEFLAMLAHELRNPLAPIRNAVQILQRGDSKAVAAASEMVERQVGQMVRLVDDLLDVSRISRGKIELRKGRIELASAVNHAVEAARPHCESMGHELTVALPPQPIYLNADPTRLAQVVGNLLNNACKFTDKGGRIWLTVSIADCGLRIADSKTESGRADALSQSAIHNPQSAMAEIRVRDSGIGLAADQLPRIFEMFIQVDPSLERSTSGLGIGLTLVKNLVEMHDGTVEVHSAGVGQGSEFIVRLPIADCGLRIEEPCMNPQSAIGNPQSRRILVVDDNRDSATSLAELLQLTGNETHTAYDGLEAVEAAATFRPEVILLDIGLPKLNGYEACRLIREQEWGKNIVLVALTGWGQEEDREKSKDVGFDGHMVKPVDLASLTKLLAEMEASAPPVGSVG